MKKIFILFIVLSFFMLAGCKEKTITPTDEPETIVNDEINYSAHDLVLNGNTDYVIMLPDQTTEEEKIAASELSVFFFEATGIKINTITEKDYTEGKYISIGKTKKLQSNGIVVNTRTLTSSGYGSWRY